MPNDVAGQIRGLRTRTLIYVASPRIPYILANLQRFPKLVTIALKALKARPLHQLRITHTSRQLTALHLFFSWSCFPNSTSNDFIRAVLRHSDDSGMCALFHSFVTCKRTSHYWHHAESSNLTVNRKPRRGIRHNTGMFFGGLENQWANSPSTHQSLLIKKKTELGWLWIRLSSQG